MRSALNLTLTVIGLAIGANGQLGNLEQCLPIPSFGSELKQFRAELRGDDEQQVLDSNRVVTVTFVGHPKMPLVFRQRLAKKLMSLRFGDGKEWEQEIAERTRQAWQNHGFFKSEVTIDVAKLPRRYGYDRFKVFVKVNEGNQYTLKEIKFKNGKTALLPDDAMRQMFPFKAHSIFSANAVREGLDRLTYVYDDHGYVKFTAVPDTQVDDADREITLIIDLDEVAQYTLSGIQVIGVTPRQADRLLALTLPLINKPYNRTAIESFWKKAQPVLHSGLTLGLSEISQNDVEHTVALHLDIRDCRTLKKKTTTFVAER